MGTVRSSCRPPGLGSCGDRAGHLLEHFFRWNMAEDFTAFAENLDIAAAGTTKFSDKLKHDTYAKGEVRVVARVQGGSVPVGAKLQGYIVYVYE